LYSAGYNNLASYLRDDIKDLESGWLPAKKNSADIVLVYSHFPTQGYSTPTSPALVRLTSDKEGKAVRDTLVVYPEGTISSSAEQLETVLTYIKENFDSERYGMVFSSHATGYLPSEYYTKEDEALSQQKSIGQDHVVTDGIQTSYEIELSDFAKAIPMHLDYILFDACFMGGVEVAYELKDKCDKICFSQTEVLSGGMDYKNLLSVLFDENGTDITTCAENYFDMYKDQKASYMRSATVSVVDCRKLEPLAEIVAKHASAIKTLANSNARASVQGYFQPRYSRYHGIFYDLEDIIKKSGASEDEMRELTDALNACILCKFATKSFLDEFDINTHSGLSMYLPDSDREILNMYYTSLKWEKRTRLIN
jgi:hypothetical protein